MKNICIFLVLLIWTGFQMIDAQPHGLVFNKQREHYFYYGNAYRGDLKLHHNGTPKRTRSGWGNYQGIQDLSKKLQNLQSNK